MAGLTWDRVNFKEGYVSLRSEDTKTRKPRSVYLVPEALDVLERASKVRSISDNHVLLYQGKPVKSIKTAFRRALEKTGIKDFRFHDLRHTFNTNLRKAEVDRSVIMKLTGHKTMAMFTRYNTVDGDDAKEAMGRFRDFLHRESSTTANSTAGEKKRVKQNA